MNKLFTGFKHKYSQEFLDELAKQFGVEWVKLKFESIPKEDVEVRPLCPPTGELFYMEINYEKTKE